ncbi:MAG TPA: LacI family DNA-binding transcriptional regulator [Ginsengibacter sp.]|nr:LacI family DNA-binding transcriptional regulator [Chitinophagaceae bacterium]MCZ2396729.1 LacI family transcriptional regulator [Chitinophagales bacterium]HRN71917.1 LacI family DNA-binding transcriptional regulator [Ginsengibacter sp.]HRP17453.1 LacI family DNA-binding transcriptional regulator [Ginsengibacter sp.]HRP44148.1 LacI family DNA-binding transcriptional regulator [Ginsengibacter sp.]
MKKVSIKDIARKTGVSITTVSIVLNGNGPDRKISGEMIEKIQKVAKELNYSPNQFAKGLRTGKTNTLGLIVDDISNFFFGNISKTVEEEANKYGYTVMFCSSQNDEGKSRDVLSALIGKQMDGYIIAPTDSMLPEIRELEKGGTPYVLIDRFFPDLNASSVTLDNYKGAYDSVAHLVKQGYSKIAIITSDTEQIQHQERLEGYKASLRKYKIPFYPDCVKKIPFKYSSQKVLKEIEDFIRDKDDIDSVLFTSNNLGIIGLEALRRLKKRVGVDLGVICFDDNNLFRLSSPAITVISQPIKGIGKNAVKILLEQIQKKKKEPQKVVLTPSLVIRESTPEKRKS